MCWGSELVDVVHSKVIHLQAEGHVFTKNVVGHRPLLVFLYVVQGARRRDGAPRGKGRVPAKNGPQRSNPGDDSRVTEKGGAGAGHGVVQNVGKQGDVERAECVIGEDVAQPAGFGVALIGWRRACGRLAESGAGGGGWGRAGWLPARWGRGGCWRWVGCWGGGRLLARWGRGLGRRGGSSRRGALPRVCWPQDAGAGWLGRGQRALLEDLVVDHVLGPGALLGGQAAAIVHHDAHASPLPDPRHGDVELAV